MMLHSYKSSKVDHDPYGPLPHLDSNYYTSIDNSFNQQPLPDESILVKTSNPKTFLQNVSFEVNMSKLLKVVDFVYYNASHQQIPILVEIVSLDLKTHYQAEYLLQIWNNKGKMLYEKPLKRKPLTMNNFENIVVFKLDPLEEIRQKESIYIVDTSKSICQEIKVADFTTQKAGDIQFYNHLGYCSGRLFVANSNHIYMAKIDRDPLKSPLKTIKKSEMQIFDVIVPPEYKIHGFMENNQSKTQKNCISCLIELPDNQMSVQILYYSETNKCFEFLYLRETQVGQLSNDRIKEFQFYIDENDVFYGASLKESRNADIYYNYSLCSISKGSKYEYHGGLHITQGEIILLQMDYSGSQEEAQLKELHLNFKYQSRIGFDVAQVKPFRKDAWSIYRFFHISKFYKEFQSMTMVGTQFLVAFSNILVSYDLSKNSWGQPIKFDKKIRRILKNTVHAEESNLLVCLENYKIYVCALVKGNDENEWQKTEVIHQLPGKIKSVVSDWDKMSRHFMMIENEDGMNELHAICDSKLIKVDMGLIKLKREDQLIRYLSNEANEDFIIYNSKTRSLKFFKSGNFMSNLMISMFQEIVITFEVKRFMIGMKTPIPNKVILFDKNHGYIIDTENKIHYVVRGLHPASILLIDEKYFYSIVNNSKNYEQGVYFQSFDTFMMQDPQMQESGSFKLKNAVAGKSNFLEYFKQEERIVYQSDFQTAKIVPILHRNIISFFGMKKRSAYLGFRKIGNNLVGLEKDGTLTTWNSSTGMLKITQPKLFQSLDLNNYSIFSTRLSDITYKMDWYPDSLLLYNIMADEQVTDLASFFGKRYVKGINGGRSYIEMDKMKFKKFKVIEIKGINEVVEHYSFVHPLYEQQGQEPYYHRLYISKDRERMLERLINQKVFLYKKVVQPGLRDIKWELIRRIEDFSYDISEFSFHNYLFSPNLNYYLDFDVSEKIYKIVKADDNTLFRKIPVGILNPLRDEPNQIARKFIWTSETEFKVINNFGFEIKVDISTDFKQVGFCKLPMHNLKRHLNDKSKNFHYYVDYQVEMDSQNPHDTEVIFERLLKKYQTYYSAMYTENKTQPSELAGYLETVDFSLKMCQEKPVIDFSFTYLHWKMCDQLAQDDSSIEFMKRLGHQVIRLLCLNIFPGGYNILHYIYNKSNLLKELYQVIELSNTSPPIEYMFNIPFLKSFNGESPLHMCKVAKNEQAADIFLQLLKYDEVDNHSRAICGLIPYMIQMELPSLDDYFKSRIMRTEILDTFKKGSLNHRKGIDYAVGSANQWPNKDGIRREILQETSRIEKEIQLKMLDIPKIHDYAELDSQEFFQRLSQAEDIQMFNNPIIQALIDFQWPLAKEFTIKMLFIPFLIYLALFVTYSNVLIGQISMSDEQKIARIVFIALLYATSIYFLINEINQVIKLKHLYFLSIWNYNDLISPVLVLILISFQARAIPNDDYEVPGFITTIHSFASLLLWAKFLYFLRIFKQTGYLINALSVVVWDMKIFLFILAIVYLGFGEAFLRLSEARDESEFIQNYAYAIVYSFRLSIGDTDTDKFDDNLQPITVWIMFVLCAVYTNIVMLNLLIAIISESFEKINNNALQASYQERAKIISENSYLIRTNRKQQYCQRNSFLIMGTYVQTKQNEDKNESSTESVRLITEAVQYGPPRMNDDFDGFDPKEYQQLVSLIQIFNWFYQKASIVNMEKKMDYLTQLLEDSLKK
eukprot:403353446